MKKIICLLSSLSIFVISNAQINCAKLDQILKASENDFSSIKSTLLRSVGAGSIYNSNLGITSGENGFININADTAFLFTQDISDTAYNQYREMLKKCLENAGNGKWNSLNLNAKNSYFTNDTKSYIVRLSQGSTKLTVTIQKGKPNGELVNKIIFGANILALINDISFSSTRGKLRSKDEHAHYYEPLYYLTLNKEHSNISNSLYGAAYSATLYDKKTPYDNVVNMIESILKNYGFTKNIKDPYVEFTGRFCTVIVMKPAAFGKYQLNIKH